MNAAFIITYTYDSTEDWIGSFPSDIRQWFVMAGALPKIFPTRDEAQKYCKDNALIRPSIIPIAGSEAGYYQPQCEWMEC